MALVIAISGFHNSGKTSLGEKVVRRLKELGLKVAVLKSTKHEDVFEEKEGKDTARYLNCGADIVGITNRKEVTLRLKVSELDKNWISYFFKDYDVVVCEGFKSEKDIPKFWVGKGGENFPGVLKRVSSEDADIVVEEIMKLLKEENPCVLFVNEREVKMKPFVSRALAEVVKGFISSLKGIPESIKEVSVSIREKNV